MFKDGLSFWPSATTKLKPYNNNKGHKIAVEQILHFLQTIKDPTKAINVRQKKSQSERLNKNRASFDFHYCNSHFLGHYGLAFRGH